MAYQGTSTGCISFVTVLLGLQLQRLTQVIRLVWCFGIGVRQGGGMSGSAFDKRSLFG